MDAASRGELGKASDGARVDRPVDRDDRIRCGPGQDPLLAGDDRFGRGIVDDAHTDHLAALPHLAAARRRHRTVTLECLHRFGAQVEDHDLEFTPTEVAGHRRPDVPEPDESNRPNHGSTSLALQGNRPSSRTNVSTSRSSS